MIQKFNGFPPGKPRVTTLPNQFFSDLLPLIDDLAELKVTLYCFWALRQKDGEFRCLLRRDFANNEALMQGLNAVSPECPASEALDAALERACARGSLLRAEVALAESVERLYFLNNDPGRRAILQIDSGAWRPGDAKQVVEILPERPTIYALYEKNIGPLTPMVGEDLKDAEKDFPYEWIVEAFQIAVASNVRSLRFIRAVLERWRREGRTALDTHQNGEQDWRRYVTDEFSDLLK